MVYIYIDTNDTKDEEEEIKEKKFVWGVVVVPLKTCAKNYYWD